VERFFVYAAPNYTLWFVGAIKTESLIRSENNTLFFPLFCGFSDSFHFTPRGVFDFLVLLKYEDWTALRSTRLPRLLWSERHSFCGSLAFFSFGAAAPCSFFLFTW